MKVAIMQPYFFPYIGYFSLIKHTDLFILIDTVQIIKQGWIERNRILKQDAGLIYIQVPLKKKDGRNSLIKDCLIDNSKKWKQAIKGQLQTYRKIAPYYFNVVNLIDEVFNNEYQDITSLNKATLEKVCSYLGFPSELPVVSRMNLDIEESHEADESALNVCKALKFEERIHYINPIGGAEFYDREKYTNNNIDISFQKMHITEYSQKREPFEGSLSIIDVMMFNSVEDVNKMLDKFTLV